MEFTFENKLNHILWEPIGHCLLETPGDSDAKLDQRRASTAHYKQHRDAIIELISMRDRAKKSGLDIEFKKIVRRVVPTGIKSGADLTRRNVFNIDLEMVNKRNGESSFKDKLEARERRMGIEVDDDAGSIDAISVLRASAPPDAEGREMGTPSFQQLINPWREHHDPAKPLKIFYTAGPNHKRTAFVMDNSRKIFSQYKELITIVNKSAEFVPTEMEEDYKTFMGSLVPLHDARMTLLKSHIPDISDEQAQYTATFYTARNAALDFERLEDKRREAYQTSLAIRTREAKKEAKKKAKEAAGGGTAAGEEATKTAAGGDEGGVQDVKKDDSLGGLLK